MALQNRTDQGFLYHAWNCFISSWCRKWHENHAENSEVLSLTGKRQIEWFMLISGILSLLTLWISQTWSLRGAKNWKYIKLQFAGIKGFQLENINSFLPLMLLQKPHSAQRVPMENGISFCCKTKFHSSSSVNQAVSKYQRSGSILCTLENFRSHITHGLGSQH